MWARKGRGRWSFCRAKRRTTSCLDINPEEFAVTGTVPVFDTARLLSRLQTKQKLTKNEAAPVVVLLSFWGPGGGGVLFSFYDRFYASISTLR